MQERWTIHACSDECKYWKVVNTIRRGEFSELCDHPDNPTGICTIENCPRAINKEGFTCCKGSGS